VTRRAGLAVVVATGVVVTGIAVRPLLHRPSPPPAQRGAAAMATPAPDTTAVDTAAAAAAVRALACDPTTVSVTESSPRHATAGWCGRYTVSRAQTTCATAARCTVELLGTVTSRARSTLVALTVTFRRDGDGWVVMAVRS